MNVYLSPAWNQGIRETAAPFILFLNPDAEWWEGTLAEYVGRRTRSTRAPASSVRWSAKPTVPSTRAAVPFPSVGDALGHAFLRRSPPATASRAATTSTAGIGPPSATVDWVSGCCMLFPRKAFDEVGLFDEAFLLYGEELDIATRLRGAGWSVLFTPEVEILHERGVSTGRSRRMTLMHSASIYRYYRKHRAHGWRAITLPIAWVALRLRAELAWLRGSVCRMKAVVLVGGQGTRLRPLTETIKKELLPLVDRTILDHTLDRLRRHGVHEVLMSSPYLEEMFHPFIESRHGRSRDHVDHGGAGARHRRGDRARDAPPGSGRALLRAERRHPDGPGHDGDARVASRARGGGDDRAAPRRGRARVRSGVTSSLTGASWRSGRSRTDAVPGDVNAGTYVFDPPALAGWTADRPISVEREIFPRRDRLRSAGGRVRFRRLLARPRDTAELPAGALRPARREGARPNVRRALGIPRRERRPAGPPRAVGRRGSGCGGRRGRAGRRFGAFTPGRSSANGPRSSTRSSVRGPAVGAGASLGASVLGEGSVVPDGIVLRDARVPAGSTASQG